MLYCSIRQETNIYVCSSFTILNFNHLFLTQKKSATRFCMADFLIYKQLKPYPRIAFTPGRTFPSMASSSAPPPVEM